MLSSSPSLSSSSSSFFLYCIPRTCSIQDSHWLKKARCTASVLAMDRLTNLQSGSGCDVADATEHGKRGRNKLAQTVGLYKLPPLPPRKFSLAVLIEYWGRPPVPWHLCETHIRSFRCALCEFMIGHVEASPLPCTAAPLHPCTPPQPSSQQPEPASQPPCRQMYMDH